MKNLVNEFKKLKEDIARQKQEVQQEMDMLINSIKDLEIQKNMATNDIAKFGELNREIAVMKSQIEGYEELLEMLDKQYEEKKAILAKDVDAKLNEMKKASNKECEIVVNKAIKAYEEFNKISNEIFKVEADFNQIVADVRELITGEIYLKYFKTSQFEVEISHFLKQNSNWKRRNK
jgi:hypothetical protein